ncbi:hypothetical protein R3W88_023079 [Solanum pinnatisectum]|uniref:Myb-like domain-containing protein n=1 Tax=Solanum pinnatisectum TaxID=50273 RepID=A0AAV9LWF9_9SOLN|nr:hypothetical protein R3W88_023079 [Solanum pinnatisectum]
MKSYLNEPSDTKTSAPASATEMQDNDKVVETLGEVSGGDVIKKERNHGKFSGKFSEVNDEVALRSFEGNKSKQLKKMHYDEDIHEDVVAEVNEADISSPIAMKEKTKTDKGKIKKRKRVKLGHNFEDPTHENSEKRVKFSGSIGSVSISYSFDTPNGNNWKVLADELAKHPWHMKETWQRQKLPNQNKGQWTQEEYQDLLDLKSKKKMLLDNNAWGVISENFPTRTDANYCLKWYDKLTSPMVTKGEWADVDDYRLVDAFFRLDASCIEDVDWDNFLDHKHREIR